MDGCPFQKVQCENEDKNLCETKLREISLKVNTFLLLFATFRYSQK
jgi:hypothetical protein